MRNRSEIILSQGSEITVHQIAHMKKLLPLEQARPKASPSSSENSCNQSSGDEDNVMLNHQHLIFSPAMERPCIRVESDREFSIDSVDSLDSGWLGAVCTPGSGLGTYTVSHFLFYLINIFIVMQTPNSVLTAAEIDFYNDALVLVFVNRHHHIIIIKYYYLQYIKYFTHFSISNNNFFHSLANSKYNFIINLLAHN